MNDFQPRDTIRRSGLNRQTGMVVTVHPYDEGRRCLLKVLWDREEKIRGIDADRVQLVHRPEETEKK